MTSLPLVVSLTEARKSFRYDEIRSGAPASDAVRTGMPSLSGACGSITIAVVDHTDDVAWDYHRSSGNKWLGKSGGGNSYGYDVVKRFQADGEPIRGDRAINETESEVVRRIFRDYVAGKSAKRIAVELNRDGISAPGGGDWGFSTINGNAKRGNGILNNEMYIGRYRLESAAFHQGP
jgi:hypothetical protein